MNKITKLLFVKKHTFCFRAKDGVQLISNLKIRIFNFFVLSSTIYPQSQLKFPTFPTFG